MERELVAIAYDREVGRVRQDARGKLSFSYARGWRDGNDSFPLSLSMPLTAAEHDDAVIRPFLEGMLPDNAETLRAWGRRFHVSANNPFALLRYVGEECPGAVQFARPERVDALLGTAEETVEWLSAADVADRLRELRRNPGASRAPGDAGYFSLAGAQPKTALLWDDGRWGIPSGRTPTTHILKPPAGHYDGFAQNEHVCLRLAAALGLRTAHTRVEWFGDEVAIVVERYDRLRLGGRVIRIHQEDTCQALGVSPLIKYENEGGPGVTNLFALLREHGSAADEDAAALVDALALNWVVGGTDAHAKNYSLLIASQGQVRLAPLYDVVSALPYHPLDIRKLKLAMRIGGEYRLWRIGRTHWERLARATGFAPEPLLQRVAEVAKAVPDLLATICTDARNEGLAHPVLDGLTDAVAKQSAHALSALA